MFSLRLAASLLMLCAVPVTGASPQPLHPVIAILPKGQLDKPYPATRLIAGGMPPYGGQVEGALPKGMPIGGTGTLFGTPREAGLFKFKIDFTDSAGASLTLTYTLQTRR